MLAVLAGISLLAALWLQDDQMARVFHDDGFFVIKTAYHMGCGPKYQPLIRLTSPTGTIL